MVAGSNPARGANQISHFRDNRDFAAAQRVCTVIALILRIPTKPFRLAAKSSRNEPLLKITPLKQWGPVMLALILNSIYRQFLRSSMSGMRELAAG
jgi:hypothetical protein